ncbi:SusD-like starch-binding protein associating with outer membrane [Sphingobacterium alimentarium]|uniref:SusD-like starch-binding protein associating with outer membrane n=1 Tax=Sphingobacterium alimentarium TaxID=797292 RepID=A0A4V6P314_9SPHI|nr:RagB/SusD family nutrient uptake outer membrane protein [Sphingobacterium alimentarium]TCV14063.1 SusD-like starch-binding protein associating with outer membrane [Sphingobacterium alimentarium]
MKKIIYILLGSTLSMMSCDSLLDRPELTKITDSEGNYWRNENDLRLFANDFYPNYFVGYNTAFGTAYAPLTGYNFADDFTSQGAQANLLGTVPTGTGGSSSAAISVLRLEHPGPNWNFYWVRKANLLLSRIETTAKNNISEEAFKHWTAVGRFFRGYEYSRLVSNFGDIPYYDQEVSVSNPDDMYKTRDPRGEVMDKVYDDFRFVLDNMRESDGNGYVNRYAAAALISNLMLFEGSWQKYHNLDGTRAKKYLEMARDAAQYVMESGKWSFSADFKSLFASESLAGNPEVIFHRTYDDGLAVRHAVGSYSNGTESQARSANLDLLKDFISVDGKVWQNSAVTNANSFRLQDLAKTRDPRFEATFMDTVNASASGTFVYAHKFAGREALSYIGSSYPPKWGSNTNTNDAPIVRLAEVVLNWIEAKQILAEFYGGVAVTQSDLDRSINAIRNRPLDNVATAKGVTKTAPLILASLPNDPERESDVSPLMWEIRRERRMEFVFEYARIQDIRRWKKLHYLNFTSEDYRLGPWIIGNVDLRDRANPGKIAPSYRNVLQVKNAAGQIITYNGTNDAEMVGYYVVRNFANRLAVQDRNYLAPISQLLIDEYKDRGFTLNQTTGW